jgi:ABC-type multidrug transport system fused ATPase/permease subunit
MRIIWSYVRTHPLPFAVAVTGAAVYAAATVASTVVLGKVTDSVITPAFGGEVGTSTFLWGAAAVIAVGLIRAAGIVTRRYFAGMTGARMQRTLREKVVERYRELPISYHRAHPTGELLAHTQADVEAATEVIHPLPFSTAVVLLIVFAVVSLLVTDLFLAVIGLAVLPFLAELNRVYSRKVEAPLGRAQQRIGELASVVHESVDGAMVVKTLGREPTEVARLAAKAESVRTERVAAGSLRATFEPLFETLPNLAIVVLLVVGAWRVSTGAITTGDLVRFVSLFLLLAFPVRVIGFALSDVPRAVVGRERLQEVFDEPVTLPPAAEALSLPEGPLDVSARSVSFSYGDYRVLEDVSLHLDPGEPVAVVGPTGSGKTTLAELLVRLADPEFGSIRLGGVDLRHVDPAELRNAAAIVFQESFLFGSTVRENIALGRATGDDDIVRAARLAQAEGFIRELPGGYDAVVGERGVTLSGGQRQRIALARALVGRPRLLILDDAMSSVDPTVEAAILEGLRGALAGTTLVVIAHRPATIALADRALFLARGRIVAEGTHRELLAHPEYAAIVLAKEPV